MKTNYHFKREYYTTCKVIAENVFKSEMYIQDMCREGKKGNINGFLGVVKCEVGLFDTMRPYAIPIHYLEYIDSLCVTSYPNIAIHIRNYNIKHKAYIMQELTPYKNGYRLGSDIVVLESRDKTQWQISIEKMGIFAQPLCNSSQSAAVLKETIIEYLKQIREKSNSLLSEIYHL